MMMNAALENLATVRRQLEAVGAAAAKDLKSIENKEAELTQEHRERIDEYRLAKENLRRAREAHDELEESGHVLDEELNTVTEELRCVQQRIDDKVRGTTDSQVKETRTDYSMHCCDPWLTLLASRTVPCGHPRRHPAPQGGESTTVRQDRRAGSRTHMCEDAWHRKVKPRGGVQRRRRKHLQR